MIALMILGLAGGLTSVGSEPAARSEAATAGPQWASSVCMSNVELPSDPLPAGLSVDFPAGAGRTVPPSKDGASDAVPLAGTACEVYSDCPANNCEICAGGTCQSACYGNEYCNGTRCIDPTACSMNCKWVQYGCCAWSWECNC